MWWLLACGPQNATRTVTITETVPVIVTVPPEEDDADRDGSPVGDDCDDSDPLRFPGAPERCDGVDSDCGGEPEDDLDGDGWFACEDCNDLDGVYFPGSADPLDGEDQSCDGTDGLAARAGLVIEGAVDSSTGMGLAFAGDLLLIGSPGVASVTLLGPSVLIEVVPGEDMFGFEIVALPEGRAVISRPQGSGPLVYEVSVAGLGEPVAELTGDLGLGMAALGEQWLAVMAEEDVLFYDMAPSALVGALTEEQAFHELRADLADSDCLPTAMVSMGDRDGDGAVELAMPRCPTGDEVYVVTPGLDSAQSEAPEIWTLSGVSMLGRTLASGDLDGDGDPELVGTTTSAPVAYVVPYYGPGYRPMANHALATVAHEDLAGSSSSALVYDLDDDGQDDLVLGANEAGVLYGYQGPVLGAQNWEDAAAIWVGDGRDSFGFRMVAGDLNSDGGPDLFVGSPDGDGAIYGIYSPLW